MAEVEERQRVLFGSLSSGVSAKQKRLEWEKVCERVNAVGSETRTPAEIKKKWSDLKVEVKRRTAALRRSTGQTGGGPGEETLTPFEQRVVAIIIIG